MAETDPITNPLNPGEGAWYEPLLGENPAAERVEALSAFDTPQAFFDKHDELTNANWRDQFAGEDDKFKTTLERYSTAADLGKAFREQKATISSGQLSAPLPEGATEDDVKAYRTERGIPLEATGYLENLPNGLVVGDEDKEIMTDFMGALHSENVPPSVAHKAIEWYNGFAEQQQDQLAELDHEHNTETEEALRSSWGSDYRANINLVSGLIDSTFGADIKDAILNARDGEGRAIMNIPEVVQGLSDLARKVNPIAQIISPKNDPVATLNDEIAEIEKFMRTNRKEYNADQKKQDRLLELYDIRIQHDNRKTG